MTHVFLLYVIHSYNVAIRIGSDLTRMPHFTIFSEIKMTAENHSSPSEVSDEVVSALITCLCLVEVCFSPLALMEKNCFP